MTQQIKYKRVLLKLSGESLMGSDPFGINHDTIVQTVGEIAEVVKMGVQVGIVVGGGNIFRGVSAQAGSMDRATADYMGMMATVMNALALKDAFETLGIKARVQSALSMQQIAETYARPKATATSCSKPPTWTAFIPQTRKKTRPLHATKPSLLTKP